MAVNDVAMTLAQAKAMLTPKGHRFDTLTDDELNAIINHPAATQPQRQAAGMVSMENHAKRKAAEEAAKLKAKTASVPPTSPEVAPAGAFQAPPKTVPDGIVASHLLEITQKLDRLTHLVEGLVVQVNTCTDSSIAVTEQMTEFVKAFKRAVTEAPAGQAAPPSTGQNGGGSFITDVIETEKRKGKTYFKVKGGRFTKHGVTVWPEVLEAAGFDPADFPVGEETQFVGHTAIFTNADPNDEGKVWPDKIIKITPKF